MTEKYISRGYVKWEDENGFHKEPLVDHPELFSSATDEQKAVAQQVESLLIEPEEKKPETVEVAPLSAAEEGKVHEAEVVTNEVHEALPAEDPEHVEKLEELREATSEH